LGWEFCGINGLWSDALPDSGSGDDDDEGEQGETTWLGGDRDEITFNGGDKDDTFIVYNAVELKDGTLVDGGKGNDTLDIRSLRGGEVLNPEVHNVETVKVKVEQKTPGATADQNTAGGDNNITDGAQIDADQFYGVNVWESYKSRDDLVIEDITIYDKDLREIKAGDATLKRVTSDVTFVFRDSDPGHVDFAAYFNPSSLVKGQGGLAGGALYLYWGNTTNIVNNQDELLDFPYKGLTFHIGDKQVEVESDAIGNATTWEDLVTALNAAFKAHSDADVRKLTATLPGTSAPYSEGKTHIEVPIKTIVISGDGLFLESWQAGNHPTPDLDYLIPEGKGVPPSASDTRDVFNEAPTEYGALVTSKIVLDNVGSGSTGGDLLIGSLSTGYTSTSRGVQQFDILVQRDSRLEVISSTNNSLEVVNIVSDGLQLQPGSYLSQYDENGNLIPHYGLLSVLGDTNRNSALNVLTQTKVPGEGYFDWHTDATTGRALWRSTDNSNPVESDQYVDGGTWAQESGVGLTDVRVIDASAFKGELILNASLTGAVVDKYLNQRDAASNLPNKDNIYSTPDSSHFQYILGENENTFDLGVSSQNLQLQGAASGNGGASGVGTREDVKISITGTGTSADTVNTLIQTDGYADGAGILGAAANATGATDWFLNEWKNTHEYTYNEYHRINKYSDIIYDAAKKDSGLYINTGAGNDTVANLGAGAWDVRLGTGNDTYYSGNTGAQRAVWVFNTRNQTLLNTADRNIGALRSDNSDTYNFKGTLTVTLRLPNQIGDNILYDDVTHELPDYTTAIPVAVPEVADGVISDLTINQAIKKAINEDPVLSKLLEAVDGPTNTLVVRSLIDGVALDSLDPGRGTGNTLKNLSYSGLTVTFDPAAPEYAAAVTAIANKGDYISALATGLTGVRDVNHVTANRVHIENGQDVVVLSTNLDSEDVLVFDTAAGTYSGRTTVVHFSTEDATNSNQGNQLWDARTAAPGGDTPIYNSGTAESFVVSFSGNLPLQNLANAATLSFNGGTAVRIASATTNNAVNQPVDVVSAFFNQLQVGNFVGGVGYGFTGPANTGLSLTTYNTDYDSGGYWNRTVTGSPDLFKFTVAGSSAVNGNVSIPTDGAPILVAHDGLTAAQIASAIITAVNAANGNLGISYGGTYWRASPDALDGASVVLTAANTAGGFALSAAQVTGFLPTVTGTITGGIAAGASSAYVNGYQDNNNPAADLYQFTIDRAATANGVFSIPDGTGTLDVNYYVGQSAATIAGNIITAINAANNNTGINYGGSLWTASRSVNDTVILTAGTTAVGANDFKLDSTQVAAFRPTFTSASVTGESFYWYVDGENRTWEVETTDNGTGIKFTRITSIVDNTEQVGPETYVNPDATVATRVDTVYNGLFTWTGLNTPTANPVSLGSIVEGTNDGSAATQATIVVDYQNSAAAYTGSFSFGNPASPLATVQFQQDDGDVTIARKVADAIGALDGWTTTRSGTTVTITRDATGSLDDPNTTANEWNWYSSALSLGGGTAGLTNRGSAALSLEVGANSGLDTLAATGGGNFLFHGLPVTVANSATPALIATAIAEAFNLARANNTLPSTLQGWAGAIAATGVDTAGNPTVIFTQTTAATLNAAGVASAFPDTLFAADSTARGAGFILDDAILLPGDAATSPSVTFKVELPNGATKHAGGVITVGNGTAASASIIIPSGATAAEIATAIDIALSSGGHDYTDGTNFWDVTASGAFLTFNRVTSSTSTPLVGAVTPDVLAGLITTVTSNVATQGVRAVADPADVANATGLLELVDDSAPAINAQAALGDNGIRPVFLVNRDGAGQVGTQVGTNHAARETQGDADYLDFSAYDAYAVVLGATNTNPIRSVTDTAELHRYVRIVETAADGVYNFTLHDAGTDGISANDTSLGLIGTVDFGESVDFHSSNFILFNDILVV
jgi:hypothetical protein